MMAEESFHSLIFCTLHNDTSRQISKTLLEIHQITVLMVLLTAAETISMGHKTGNNSLNRLFHLLIFCTVHIDTSPRTSENSDSKYLKSLFY